MGRFSVEVDLANVEDEALARGGHLPFDQVRRRSVRGVVDKGATHLVLPEKLADELGLRREGQAGVRLPGGRTAVRDRVIGVSLTCAGRSAPFSAIVEPGCENVRFGLMVTQALDLVIDCTHQTLTPRDPERIIVEIE